MSILVASICICIIVFLFGYQVYLKPDGVGINEEWREANATQERINRQLYVFIGCLLCAFGAYILTGHLLFCVFALPGGFWMANWYIKKKEKDKRELLKDQYREVIRGLASAVQGGLTPVKAMEDTVASLPSPAKEVFIEILRRQRAGWPLEDAIDSVSKETDWEELKSLRVAISMDRRVGGNLIKVFEYLEETAYEQASSRSYIKAQSGQSRATAKFMSCLPFVVLVIERYMSPEYTECLFTTVPGAIIIILSVVSVIFGNMMMDKMIESVMNE